MYVNTDSVLIRDRPTTDYIVVMVANKACRLKIEKCDSPYLGKKAIIDKFYRVSYAYPANNGLPHIVGGWVMKKYLRPKPFIVKQLESNPQKNYKEADLVPYSGNTANNPNKENRFLYPYPKYKGGERNLVITKTATHQYLKGVRGGCYYFTKSGRKVYVDKKFCDMANEKSRPQNRWVK